MRSTVNFHLKAWNDSDLLRPLNWLYTKVCNNPFYSPFQYDNYKSP
jgi:hypothetical protein